MVLAAGRPDRLARRRGPPAACAAGRRRRAVPLPGARRGQPRPDLHGRHRHAATGACGRSWATRSNLAARVMGRAEPGQVLAAADLLDRTARRLRAHAGRAVHGQGQVRPGRAEVVGPARARPALDEPPPGPLVGPGARARGSAPRCGAARDGGRVMVELVGEPGIGKSRLVEATLAEADGLTVVAVAGGPYACTRPTARCARRCAGCSGCRRRRRPTSVVEPAARAPSPRSTRGWSRGCR